VHDVPVAGALERIAPRGLRLRNLDDLLGRYAKELEATDQTDEAKRVLDLAADATSNFLMIVPLKVQADPSISTE